MYFDNELTPIQVVLALLTPLLVFAGLLVLHLVIPAWKVPGYIRDDTSSEIVQYRLNGIVVFLIALAVWWFDPFEVGRDWLWRAFLWSLVSGTVLSIVLTLYFVLKEPPDEQNIGLSLWTGRRLNVVLFNRLEIKMYLYIVGGTVLALNALSGAALHFDLHGAEFNPGVFLYAGMWVFFAFDYYCFERVQLYTYDLIHEKLGFKLLWGCFVVYPYLYLIPLLGLVHLPAPELSETAATATIVISALVFLIGWVISRGSNLQKYVFKRWPEKRFLGVIQPKALVNGELKILCSGFWGISRHPNYLGEILMALAMALCFGHFANPWAWSYFVFIVVLFVNRQRDDDRLCASKYGVAWEEYTSQTPYRIIPRVY